jgi:photosystem II stability/assembly factor-like uncharacterized protein
MYAATVKGLLKTTDGGANWSEPNSGLPASFRLSQVAIDPQNANTIYVGILPSAWMNGRPLDGGVFKSTDGGATWSSLTLDGTTGPAIGAFTGTLSVDPQNPSTLFAGGSLSSGPQSNPWGLFESTDGGSTWTHTSFGNDATAVAFDAQNAGTLYVGVGFGKVLKSTDEGLSWTELSLPQDFLPTEFEDCETCIPVHLAVDPQRPNTIYIGGSSGLWKSTDGGASWNMVIPRPVSSREWWPGIGSLVIDPQHSDNVYAAIGNTVFRSTDGAASWNDVTGGLTVVSISNLMIDPRDPRTIYAGTAGGGVFAITFVP